jgi:RHS repeat-associated protein
MGYRYGFNGKENDNEVKGEGEQQDYGFRIYDPRIAKFLSVDPITAKYPELTPYQFASNNPIFGIDLDGLEIFPGSGYLVDKLSQGATQLGLPRTAGFISSYGHSLFVDPIYSSHQFTKTAAQGDGFGVAQQLDPTGILSLPSIYQTTKSAAQGNAYAQGEVLGMLPGLYGGIKTAAAVKSAKAAPEVKTSGQVEAAHGSNGAAKPGGTVVEDRWANFDFEENKTVYHKGNLTGGKVSPERTLSTGMDRASVDAIRGGTLYEFKIPLSKFNEWISKGWAEPLKDYDHQTGVVNEEIRFGSKVANELNNYMVKDKK